MSCIHPGVIGCVVSRTTLAKANENRDWLIYAEFTQVLIRTAKGLYVNDPITVEMEVWNESGSGNILYIILFVFSHVTVEFIPS